MYEIVKEADKILCVLANERRTAIPIDPSNADYQAFLEWVAEGNEPEVVAL